MLGSVTRRKICQPTCAQAEGGHFLVGADRLHHGDQFAGDKRERHKGRRQDQAGQGENDRDAVLAEPRPEIALQPEQAARTSARRRPAKWQTASRSAVTSSERPRKTKPRDGPGRGDAEDDVERDGDRRHDQRQQNRVPRVGIADEVVPIRLQARPTAPGKRRSRRERRSARRRSRCRQESATTRKRADPAESSARIRPRLPRAFSFHSGGSSARAN